MNNQYPIGASLRSIEIPRRVRAKIDIKSAGNGNRTRMASLEGWNFTIKLCPRGHTNCRGPARLPSDFSRGPGALDILVIGV